MRTFIISDIHGFNDLFKKALKEISFTKEDQLYLLGDYIDRGPDSKGVLDTILVLQNNGFEVHCLRGNHEQMLLDALSDFDKKMFWLQNGGIQTLESFQTSKIELIPQVYVDFMSNLPYYFEVGEYLLVHATINTSCTSPLEDYHAMLWSRSKEIDSSKIKNRKVIHGHTPIDEEQIAKQRAFDINITLDNAVFFKKEGFGSLCILELNSFEFSFIKAV